VYQKPRVVEIQDIFSQLLGTLQDKDTLGIPGPPYTVKKVPVPFPAPSRDVNDKNLSCREQVFLMKLGVFTGYSLSQPGILESF
jgi:hypothetical protein